jgi:hypothetical protein
MMLNVRGILVLFVFPTTCHSFAPIASKTPTRQTRMVLESSTEQTNVAETSLFDDRTGKPTGTSFLPNDTIERARKNGSPIEKVKLEKDGTSAFVDVYEYARKIRNGEMTWEEVDKADLDTVRYQFMYKFYTSEVLVSYFLLFPTRFEY